jgi:hypothetical protein
MTNDWKPEKNISSPWDVDVRENNIGQAKEDGVFTFPEPMFIHQPKQSNYTCYLFGGDAGSSPITWTPQEGKVPNAWVRFWMKIFFNCKWVKNDD